MSTIASLSNSLDTAAKFVRVLEKEEVSLDHLLLPVNDKAARRNLAAYLKAGCPKLEEQQRTVPAKPQPLLSVSATTNLGSVEEKKTNKCFTGSRWAYRDGDFDRWLPANQPTADASAISTLAPSRDWTFAEAAARILGVGVGTSIQMLGKALIENGHTMTLSQAEEMVEKTERGEETGMHTDGYGNFFFVETGDVDDPVSVGDVDRGGRVWSAGVGSFGGGNRWGADDRLLVVRNFLDALKL